MNESITEFFAMGGYAPYVWGAYGLTLILLVINIVAARRRLRSTLADLALRHSQRNDGSNS